MILTPCPYDPITQERHWSSVSQFGGMVYWNLETNPSSSDPMLAALEWLEIAQARKIMSK